MISFTDNLRKSRPYFWCLAILCCVQTGCVAASEIDSGELMRRVQIASQTDNLAELLRLEQPAIANAKKIASRDGSQLILKIDGGEEVHLANKCFLAREKTDCIKYALLSYYENIEFYLIGKFTYENVYYILVNKKNGEKTYFRGLPMLSPTGRYALIFLENDELFGFGVQVWRRDVSSFKDEWSKVDNSDGDYVHYSLIAWRKDEEVLIKTAIYDSTTGGEVDKIFRLTRQNGKWVENFIEP